MKTYEEINDKIRKGSAVVLTADEMTNLVSDVGTKKAAEMVDVVTTGTFGPMCSSGVIINFGQPSVPIKMKKVILNGVEAYGGLASADAYIGATALSSENPQYGGANVISDLVEGKSIWLQGYGTLTDCKHGEYVETYVDKNTLNECIMFNPRNCYQNYNAATNSGESTLNTYLGVLKPQMGSVAFSGAGQLSPLVNDPNLRTIGIGTKIFLSGAEGVVVWNGTQFKTDAEVTDSGVPIGPGRTIAVVGDLKHMDSKYLKAINIKGYGVTLCVGIGIPIPILDEEMAYYTSISNEKIVTNIIDFNEKTSKRPVIRRVTYKELCSGKVELNNKAVPAFTISNQKIAKSIADELKNRVKNGLFLCVKPVGPLPVCSSVNSMHISEEGKEIWS